MRVGDENWLIESVKCLAVGIVGLENWLDDDEKSRRGGVELANCPRSSVYVMLFLMENEDRIRSRGIPLPLLTN
ncbi:Large ribosomal subunit protein uL1B [Trichinella spiralis]|uniref:Large ribosomal subunit protein uL1B n=1 Tax=Trichinella spiralis TaxID=6334 RepID=A0ABR3KPP6_TRISP